MVVSGMADEPIFRERAQIILAKGGEAETLGIASDLPLGTAGGLAMLVETVKQVVDANKSPTKRFQEAAEELDAKALHEEMVNRGEKLLEQTEEKEVDQADVLGLIGAVGGAWGRARRRCINRRQGRLIAAAALHSFDPEAYREGWALIVLEVLEGLDYPDLVALKDFEQRIRPGETKKNLNRASLDWFHAVRLQDRKLLLLNNMKVSQVTELGHKVLEYVGSELSALGQEE